MKAVIPAQAGFQFGATRVVSWVPALAFGLLRNRGNDERGWMFGQRSRLALG